MYKLSRSLLLNQDLFECDDRIALSNQTPPIQNWSEQLLATLESRRRSSELRTHLPIQSTEGVHHQIAGQQFLSFATNNYLGLSQHPAVVAACQKALAEYGVGSGSAYLITGYTAVHQELELRLAEFLHYPRVLLLSSGYMGNYGVMTALFGNSNTYLYGDKLNHASLVDGALATKAVFRRYPHGNHERVATWLQGNSEGQRWIITEGLFGMDGTVAPLRELVTSARQHQASVMVDDAHGIGVLGENGRGSMELTGTTHKDVSILTGTLSKALGGYGGFVASNELIIDNLIQLMRPYLYTTAIPPAFAAGAIASLDILQQEPWRRRHINELCTYFQLCTQQLAIPCLPSKTPIQLVLLKSSHKAVAVSERLFEKGLLVRPIRPPTVPQGGARLRITLTANHTKAQVDFLLESLSDILKAG